MLYIVYWTKYLDNSNAPKILVQNYGDNEQIKNTILVLLLDLCKLQDRKKQR